MGQLCKIRAFGDDIIAKKSITSYQSHMECLRAVSECLSVSQSVSESISELSQSVSELSQSCLGVSPTIGDCLLKLTLHQVDDDDEALMELNCY